MTVGQVYLVTLQDSVYTPHWDYTTRVRLVSEDDAQTSGTLFSESVEGPFVTLDVLSGPMKGKRTTVALSGATFKRTFVPETEN